MFTALREDGTPMYLLPRIARTELLKEKKCGKFFCPECKEELILKAGACKIEHFAHRKGSNCLDSYERESDYHLNGKLQLFEWLMEQNLHPKLEPYYETIHQRPDIAFAFGERTFALEFQCSAIPPDLFVKRTRRYQANKHEPLWLLGGKNIKRIGKYKVSLSHFDYLFLIKSKSGIWYLPAFCSSTQQFILLTNITPVSTRTILAHPCFFSIKQITFTKLFQMNRKNVFPPEVWKREIQAQKSNLLLQGFKSSFLKELYVNFLNITLLPPYLGIPVLNAPIIETGPLIWQTYLFLDQLWNKEAMDKITFNEVYVSFMKRVQKNQVVLRRLPLIPNVSPTIAIMEYMNKLAQYHVLERLNQNTFRLRKKIVIPEHAVQQLKIENEFYSENGHTLFS